MTFCRIWSMMASSIDPLLFTIVGVTSTKEYLRLYRLIKYKRSFLNLLEEMSTILTDVKSSKVDKKSKKSLGKPT